MYALKFQNVGVNLQNDNIIENISFEVSEGKLVALLGPNGAGKTTLLKAAAGLLPYHGSISLFGEELRILSAAKTGNLISYIPQGVDVHWPMYVKDIVALGRLPHHHGFRKHKKEDFKAIDFSLERMDLRHIADKPFNLLSGGEKSRVMIGRALATEAKVLLADEPIAALDPYHQLRIMDVIRNCVDEGMSAICTLHDIFLAAQFADIVVLLHHGHVVDYGPPEQVLTSKILKKIYNISPTQDIEFEKGLWQEN